MTAIARADRWADGTRLGPYVIAVALGGLLELVVLASGAALDAPWLHAAALLGPPTIVIGVQYPTLLLGPYFYIGQLKLVPGLSALPGNLSIALGLFVAGLCGLHLLRERRSCLSTRAAVLFAALAALVVVAYLRSSSPVVGTTKLMYLVTFVAVSFGAPMLLIVDRRRADLFLVGLIGVAAIEAAAMFGLAATDPAQYRLARMGVGGGPPIATAMALATGTLAALFWWLPRTRGIRAQVAVVGLAAFLVAGLLATGSRGPFLFLVLGIAVGLLLHLRVRSRSGWTQLARVSLVVLGLVAAIWGFRREWFSGQFTGAERAFGVLEHGAMDISRNPRTPLMRAALEMVAEQPLLGHGLGDFNHRIGHADTLDYATPHSMFLEVACEVGLPATLLALAIVLISLRMPWKILGRRETPARLRQVVQTAFLVHLFFLMENQLSGEAFRTRALWGFTGASIAIAILARRELEQDGGRPGPGPGDEPAVGRACGPGRRAPAPAAAAGRGRRGGATDRGSLPGDRR